MTATQIAEPQSQAREWKEQLFDERELANFQMHPLWIERLQYQRAFDSRLPWRETLCKVPMQRLQLKIGPSRRKPCP